MELAEAQQGGGVPVAGGGSLREREREKEGQRGASVKVRRLFFFFFFFAKRRLQVTQEERENAPLRREGVRIEREREKVALFDFQCF
jgi:hypothetical protein